MLEPSQRLKKEAARLGCEVNHIIMADLVLSGYTENEAYDIAYSERVGMSAQQKISEREREYASDGYKRAYEEKRNTRKYKTEQQDLRDKETVARELNTLITSTTDPKLKAELLMKLADLQQMKKDATAIDEEPVRFYLPLSCERCPLLNAYNDFVAKRNKGKKQSEQDLTVRPDEMQRLIEQSIPVVSAAQKSE